MKPDKEIFERISASVGRDVALLEKDYYVVQVIKKLSELQFDNGRLLFGGGTSLFKGHKVINRFSEDIDFRFVSEAPLNRNQKSKIKHKITEFLEALPDFTFHETPRAQNGNTKIDYRLKYPQADSSPRDGLRPYIRLEVFFAGVNYPAVSRSIGSLYNEYAGAVPEVEFSCVALEDTAIDKVSAFLWRVLSRDRTVPLGTLHNDPTIIRHLHDIALLKGRIVIEGKFKRLLTETLKNDMQNRAHQEVSLREAFGKVAELLSTDRRYRQEYRQYVDSVSLDPDNKRLSFDAALKVFEELAGMV